MTSFPVETTPSPAALTDHSGSIVAGGTAQILMAANASRKGGRIQNTSNGDLWFKDISATGADASVGGPGCFRLAAGGYFETQAGGASQTAWSIFGSTTGQTFSATEW
jgi:hypothetical protein